MSIPESIRNYRAETGMSQRQLAEHLHMDDTYISKIEKGKQDWPDHFDSSLSTVNWRFALDIAEERTNGWIRSRFKDVDPTPAALQLQLRKEMQEALFELEGIILANNIDWSKRDNQLAKVQKEISDVVEIGMILKGVIQDIRKEAKRK